MENANLLVAFIVVTAFAVVIQAGILVALYLSIRKSSARMEALATEVKNRALPAVEAAHAVLVDLHPKLDSIADNLSHTTTLMRAQVERLDATVSDAIDRARLQVIRADELVNRTMDKVEETTEVVHKTVLSPLRRATGLMHGVGAGLEFLFGRRRRQRRDGMGVQQDEMFI
jgi:hypothetical protein